jgi:hypothetical protein
MCAGIEELPQPFGRMRDRIRPCYADGIEAMGAGSLDQRRLDSLRRQKSRLA